MQLHRSRPEPRLSTFERCWLGGATGRVRSRWRSGQAIERGAHYFADRCRRLRNDIGDLPIRARALRVQSPDCDELDFAAAKGPPSNFQAFRLKPSPAFGLLRLPFSFFASWTKG
jgi:hypothetical protein